jgi:DNA-directed RNA polymerase subunit RPC12/RpoP
MDVQYWILIIFGLLIALVIIFWIISRQRRGQVEAIEEDLPRRPPREMVVFDEEAAEVLERRIVKCSNCSGEVSPYDEECPNCGARLSLGRYECSNCGSEVDPRDKECPQCGEILLPDPYVCPNCLKPVEMDSQRCDNCGARYWSPILLDEATLKKRRRKLEDTGIPKPEEKPEETSRRRRSLR